MAEHYTEEVDLAAELERLRAEKAERDELAAELDDDHDHQRHLQQERNRLSTFITGVEWALERAHRDDAMPTLDDSGHPCSVWNESVDSITIRALAGDYELMGDELSTIAQEHDLAAVAGAARLRTIAYGTAEAPYHDPATDVDERIEAVAQLAPEFREWADYAINKISRLGNWSGSDSASERGDSAPAPAGQTEST